MLDKLKYGMRYIESVDKKTNTPCITAVVKCIVEYPDSTIKEVTFSGTARYKDGDVNDIENAKNIASSKMERQYYKLMKQIAIERYEKYLELTEAAQKELQKIEGTITSINNHIIDLATDKTTEDTTTETVEGTDTEITPDTGVTNSETVDTVINDETTSTSV